MNQKTFWGSGWSFPPTFQKGNHQLMMTHNVENINLSIDTILKTKQGERSLLPYFGNPASLFLFENVSTVVEGEIINNVKLLLLEYEPRITVEDVYTEISNSDTPIIDIHIKYKIVLINSRYNHVYPFHIHEGTDLVIPDGQK